MICKGLEWNGGVCMRRFEYGRIQSLSWIWIC